MTPQETEQFAALRMHVAHLHAALKEACHCMDGTVHEDVEGRWLAALAESEAEVCELLKDADRDLTLAKTREAVAELSREINNLAHELQAAKTEASIIVAAARAVVEILEWPLEAGYDSPEDDATLADAKGRIAELAKVLPAP